MTERNIELLQVTMQFIKDNPHRHNRSTWFFGTAACFVGWACRTAHGMTDDAPQDARRATERTWLGGIGDVRTLASSLLGLDCAFTLFERDNTIEMLELMVKDLCSGDELREAEDYA